MQGGGRGRQHGRQGRRPTSESYPSVLAHVSQRWAWQTAYHVRGLPIESRAAAEAAGGKAHGATDGVGASGDTDTSNNNAQQCGVARPTAPFL